MSVFRCLKTVISKGRQFQKWKFEIYFENNFFFLVVGNLRKMKSFGIRKLGTF